MAAVSVPFTERRTFEGVGHCGYAHQLAVVRGHHLWLRKVLSDHGPEPGQDGEDGFLHLEFVQEVVANDARRPHRALLLLTRTPPPGGHGVLPAPAVMSEPLGQLRMWPAIPSVLGDNYRLSDVAAVLGRSVQGLRQMAMRGEFPRLFRLSRNDWRVEKLELEGWAARRWESADSPRLRAEAVRSAIRQPAWLRRQPRVRKAAN